VICSLKILQFNVSPMCLQSKFDNWSMCPAQCAYNSCLFFSDSTKLVKNQMLCSCCLLQHHKMQSESQNAANNHRHNQLSFGTPPPTATWHLFHLSMLLITFCVAGLAGKWVVDCERHLQTCHQQHTMTGFLCRKEKPNSIVSCTFLLIYSIFGRKM